MKIAVMFHRLGPYHVARLSAAGARCHLTALELTAMDDIYQWDMIQGKTNFEWVTVFRSDHEARTPGILSQRLKKVLSEIGPDVLAIPGWKEKSSLIALQWALDAGVRTVVMSDSKESDANRKRYKEGIKRRIVQLYSSGLVGGTPHLKYLGSLGMQTECIFIGYDVVDNGYFDASAERSRQTPGERERLKLPDAYFLASNRFVAVKNLERLLEAYARYRKRTGKTAWKLVLLGDGPLKEKIIRQRQKLCLENDLQLPGFKQYHELPVYYGYARTFVLASTNETWGLVVNEAMASRLPILVSNKCGCVSDLVMEGRNGFTFDPFDVEGLAGLMEKMSSGEVNLEAMGNFSREIITGWCPDRFASGLLQAAKAALSLPVPKMSLTNRVLLQGLIHL